MKIRKTVTEKGYITVEIEVDEKFMNIDHKTAELNKVLTGVDSNNYGIFTGEDEKYFSFGDYNIDFTFSKKYDKQASIFEIAELLEDHIKTVKNWIAKCKIKAHTETAEILTNDEVIERLKDENRLLYRNKVGQIQTLDI